MGFWNLMDCGLRGSNGCTRKWVSRAASDPSPYILEKLCSIGVPRLTPRSPNAFYLASSFMEDVRPAPESTHPYLLLGHKREQKETQKVPLTFSSLVFLVFSSLFLNYLFLLVYLVMELVAYFYGSLSFWVKFCLFDNVFWVGIS